MFSYRFFPRIERNEKDETVPMYCQVIFQRKKSKFKLPFNIYQKHFDFKKNRARPSSPLYTQINTLITEFEAKAERIILENTGKGKAINLKLFKALLLSESNASSLSLKNFVRERINSSQFSWNTIRNYKVTMSSINSFAGDVLLGEINYTWIINFRHHLFETGNSVNTVRKKLGQLKALLNEAIKFGYINENPFKNIPLKSARTQRVFLEMHEVMELEKLRKTKGVLTTMESKVLQYFLFSCYTGLRYSDVVAFDRSMVINDTLYIKMEKTSDPVSIPLLPQAIKLLPENKFEIISNQKTNQALKAIMEKAGISKSISFHCARHSFATIGISSKIPIEVISKLLGHREIKTTAIYAHIVEDVKKDAMKRWGKTEQ